MSLFLEYARSQQLYKALCGVLESEDGNLLERTDMKTAEAQTEFLRWALNVVRPTTILEIGTNKGMFIYFVSVVARDVTIHTFDIDPACARAVDLLNSGQSNVVAVFHEGDTRATLRDAEIEAQFAWLDGGQQGDTPLNDLMQCFRLRVPYVAIDDSAFPVVQTAIDYVQQHTPYRTVGNPFLKEDRRRAVLLGLSETR
jgi:hypothetical protein